MLKGLLKVKAQSAKQAVVTAINLLGMKAEDPREFLLICFSYRSVSEKNSNLKKIKLEIKKYT